MYHSNPSGYWVLVQCLEAEEVVGGGEWLIYKKKAYADGIPKLKAIWWPEGEGRRFGNEVLQQCYALRYWWMKKLYLGKMRF